MEKLTIKDRKILWELEHNARQSAAQIAKKTRLSQQVVDYRIKRMEEKGIITGYNTIINFSKLGYIYARLKFKLSKPTKELSSKVIKDIKASRHVVWICKTQGGNDIVLAFLVKSIPELHNIFKSIIHKNNVHIESKQASIAAKFYNLKHKHLMQTKSMTTYSISGENFSNYVIDEYEYNLLSIISNDARIPLVKLAEKLSLPVQTVRAKLKKLENNDIIQEYRPEINPGKLGLLNYHVYMSLDEQSEENEKRLVKYLLAHNHTTFITHPIGYADLEFDILLPNDYQLTQFMHDLQEKFVGIIKSYGFMLFYDIESFKFFPNNV